MKKTYIGIDPGIKGGIAIIDSPDKSKDKNMAFEMILTPEKKIDVNTIYNILEYYRYHDKICIIEKAQAMPKQGVKGVFNYGMGYGKLIAVLELLSIPYIEIHPTKWKKEFSLFKKTKADSVATAEKLFPDMKGKFITQKGRLMDGKAESLLMAEYGRRKNL